MGFLTNSNKRECIVEVVEFVQKYLGVTVTIEDIHFMSRNSSSPMIIMFKDMHDKAEVFRNVSTPQNVENTKGSPFFMNCYLTAENREL